MLELLIAVRAGVGGDLLAVTAQREIHLVEKTSDCIGPDRDVDLLEHLCDLLGRFPVHFSPVMGSPAVSCSRRISMASIILYEGMTVLTTSSRVMATHRSAGAPYPDLH